ncbi:hypothetical protein CD928_05785 [Sphingopyxis sp. GW247-27LB]|nr:hypothetical protein CD928_05785 [Sphingopyxis sp. GW247-27LB]
MVALLLVAGCASVGTNYSAAAVDQLRAGMSRAEVISIMGEPTSRAVRPDGRYVLGWSHARSSAFGATTAKAIFLGFDPDGRYTGALSESESDSK